MIDKQSLGKRTRFAALKKMGGRKRSANTAAARLRAEKGKANREKHELALLEQIRASELPEPEREYRFAALSVGWSAGKRLRKGEQGLREKLAHGGVMGLGDWRFDFAWPDLKVAVEIEGGVWQRRKTANGRMQGGRHQTSQGFMDDCRKYREAAALGWRVFRFTGEEVQKDVAIRFLEKWFAGSC